MTNCIIYWKAKYNKYSEQSKLELSGLVGSEVSRSVYKYGGSDTCRSVFLCYTQTQPPQTLPGLINAFPNTSYVHLLPPSI